MTSLRRAAREPVNAVAHADALTELLPFALLDKARGWWADPAAQAVERRQWFLAHGVDPDDVAVVASILEGSSKVSSLERSRAWHAFKVTNRWRQQ